jgi:hypothetical protein
MVGGEVGDEGAQRKARTVLDAGIADTTPLRLDERVDACSGWRGPPHAVLTAAPATTVAARR